MPRLALFSLLMLGTAPVLADLADEVRCREIGFSQAAEQQDFEAFRAFLDPDARFVSDSVLRGVDAIAEAWSVFFQENGPSIRWRPQIIEVLENGALALSRGPYRVIATDDTGKAIEQWGTFNSIWRLHDDGTWRVVFDAGSPAAGEIDEQSKALLEAEDACP